MLDSVVWVAARAEKIPIPLFTRKRWILRLWVLEACLEYRIVHSLREVARWRRRHLTSGVGLSPVVFLNKRILVSAFHFAHLGASAAWFDQAKLWHIHLRGMLESVICFVLEIHGHNLVYVHIIDVGWLTHALRVLFLVFKMLLL